MKHTYSLGIGVNLFDARAILLRDDKKILAEINKNHSHKNANDTLEVLLGLCDSILGKAKKYKNDLAGIGLALGGIVNNKKGVAYWPQRQNTSCVYISLPLKSHLEKKYGLPVFLENDANACVWAEHTIHYPKHKNLLYMFSGVGCGIVADGALYRGKDGSAGELFLNPQKVMCSPLGDFSFLQQWPADLNIVKRAKELIARGKGTSLIKRISPTGTLTLNDIFAAAKSKDKVAREVLQEAAFALGVKIAFLVNLLNPEAVLIGGGLENAGEVFLEECITTVKSFSFSEMRKNVKIAFSQMGREATSVGAALLVLQEKALQG